ncbi:MAG TPA: hypothetical protein PKN87_02800 [Syntrophomonadaceae bacterium]|nr:hypothetical protein [Syntrophomonadaceae bacterium]HNX28325.1 hypothetical protein [Syntrophomonadaceae bacterium]HPR92532.1 hypothetical protein [Syntrophomonadaceae bacterium]
MNNALAVLAAFIAGILVEAIVLHFIISMLRETNAVRKNYLNIDIPVSAGISFPFTLIIVYILLALPGWYDSSYHLFILAAVAISFLGFIDDMLGQRDALGFKGHFGALFKGRLTTGGLKALGGGMLAFFIAFSLKGSWPEIILNTFIIALAANLMNLFDLRPGRAVKAYLLFLLVIIIIALGRVEWMLIAPLTGAVFYYAKDDLKAGVMMGDAGSNVLGMALGYFSVISLSLPVRLGVLVFLLGIHLYTEKYSLTTTIENNQLLKRLDDLGRSRQNG